MLAEDKKPRSNAKLKVYSKWHWGQEQQCAFDDLRNKLTSPSVLAFLDFSKSFKLHTDTCQTGLGVVLYQEQDALDKVIDYASRGLSKSETH